MLYLNDCPSVGFQNDDGFLLSYSRFVEAVLIRPVSMFCPLYFIRLDRQNEIF